MDDLRSATDAFIRDRDWEQFHSLKNLAMALSVEAPEVVEHSQRLIEEQNRSLLLGALDLLLLLSLAGCGRSGTLALRFAQALCCAEGFVSLHIHPAPPHV